MSQFTNKADVITGGSSGIGRAAAREPMNSLLNILIKCGILKEDLDYHLICASIIIIFLFFGYQKWFE
jgi:short-subunit dehydrogenase involved in D-alanine esterification of teichoic acids